MKFGIIVFPGSNCDHDCYHVIKHVFGQSVEYVWHKSDTLDGFDCIVLPGGFSYGDYLRTGAIARFSPVMEAVVKFAEAGGIVIGICNGFQVLTEVGLLPGVLMRNRELKFICETVSLSVDNTATRFTSEYSGEETVSIPIAHADGSYYADAETIKELEDSSRVLFRYATPEGVATEEANPNGSVNSIAGIINAKGNVMGMMPHPERACESELGSTDGRGLFESVINSLVAG
jgi:phosphoribosylformylglycinamidine synthase